jgi:hypothetical protein
VGKDWLYSTVHNSTFKVIGRVGLLEQQQFRTSRCDTEENEWRHELQSSRQIVPEIRSLLLMKIKRSS